MPLRTSLIALALAIGAILPIRSDHARTRDTLPPDLVRAIEAFDRAQVAADTATLARLVTDDYVLVNSDASVDRKQKYLADFLLPGLRMEPYVIEQRIEKTWGDAAVVFGLQRLSWTQDGQRHQRVLRIVHVWTKRNGRWQATHTQLTRVQQVQTLKDHHVADVEELRSKFVALAEVFPEDYYNCTLALTEPHEHLGQLIAYARMIRIVPPWSR